MLHTFVLSLLASAVAAQLSDSNLEKHVGTLSLSASFNPIQDSYWTGLPHHRRTPFAVSPDGKSAYLAYLDASKTGVHVQKVDPTTFAAVGEAVTVAGGKEAGGLVAHNDGFALLTNEAMPSGTTDAPPENTPVAVLYRYTGSEQTFKTWLGGPSLDSGMGNLATPDINGDLAFSEASGMYGAYFVVTAYSGSAKGHFGDAIQYVSENGTLEQIPGASSGWGCSHNTGIAFEAADSVPFASLCAEDQGAIWLNTGNSGMDKSGVKVSNENVQNGASNEPMGGMSGSYSGLARFIDSDSYIFTWVSRGAKDLSTNEWMGDGYTTSVNRTVNRNVAIATFSDKKTLVGEQATSTLGGDGDSQINWITTGSADCQNAHAATFDGKNALITWEEIAEPTCEFIAMGCKGAFTGAYYQLVTDGKKVGEPIKSMDTFVAGDMVTMADGRICWPYVDMDWKLDGPVSNPASVKAISFACMALNAGSGTAASPNSTASETLAASSAASVQSSSAAAAAAAAQPSSLKENVASSDEPKTIDTTAQPSVTAAPEGYGNSVLPTFELVTSGATITPPASSINLDLPNPTISVQLPEYESFVASQALAFTSSTEIPNPSIGPASSTTYTSSIEPTPTEYPTQLPDSAYGTGFPTETEQPTQLPDSAYGTGFPTEYPTQLPESAYGSGFPTEYPTQLPESAYGTGFPTETEQPTQLPDSAYGTGFPTETEQPTQLPDSAYGTGFPTETEKPTQLPDSAYGTGFPTEYPTQLPESAYSSELPTETEQPTQLPDSAYGTGFPTEYPTQLPESAYGSGFPTEYPTQLPESTYGSGFSTDASVAPSSTRISQPSYHSGRPGFGWGRPRPSGWGSWGSRPTTAPSADYQSKYNSGMGKASSTPCTLETRVRPTATPSPASY